jgi:hypothetical protein
MDRRVKKCKTKLSRAARGHVKAFENIDAAIGYLEEAKRYEPERTH